MPAPKVDYHRINSLKAKVYDCMSQIEDAMQVIEQRKKEIAEYNSQIIDEQKKQKADPSKK